MSDLLEKLADLATPSDMYNMVLDIRAELARLQEIEKAAKKVKSSKNKDYHIFEAAMKELSALLDGDK